MKRFEGLLCHRGITYSTWLTIFRICLIPFISFSLYTSAWHSALVLFLIASLTDILDGYLARLRDERTKLGALLDPVADKFLILTVYTTLFFSTTPYVQVPAWFLTIILFKEIALVTGGFFLYRRHKNVSVHVSLSGKAAMLIQVMFVAWLILVFASVVPAYALLPFWLGSCTLFAVVAFGVYTVQGILSW